MRINIYDEELGEGVDLIQQTSRNGEVFLGLRVWLKSPQEILDHSTPEDDDRSAVTFWSRDVNVIKVLIDQMRLSIWIDP
jgi:hypothetical protein